MTTILTTGHPLMQTKDERLRILAVLRHLGSGADLRDFPVSPSEKVALVRIASQRRLIVWHKGRSRYELTPAGWCALAPSRRFGVGSMMLGTGLGATLGAAALAVFWFAAGPAQEPLAPRSAVASASARVAKASAPAVAKPAPAAVPTAAPAAPPEAATPAGDAAPAAAPAEAEPTKVAQEPTPEQLAEAAAKTKQAAAKKARQRATARRRREEAARAWAATDPSRNRAQYSGYGYGGYGGPNAGFAYR
ncbi:MAG TPA: hypothetical protein VK456_14370 [Xanthobacteraceae bacterium]|nr:hypothetical protein [Xanthobacteraceae bacterium]